MSRIECLMCGGFLFTHAWQDQEYLERIAKNKDMVLRPMHNECARDYADMKGGCCGESAE